MMTERKPENFDWVKARHECSLYSVFKHLELDAEANVAMRNSIRGPEDKHFGFKVVTHGNTFSVLREMNVDSSSVRFSFSGTHIEVAGLNGKPMFVGSPTLCNDGQCRLKVNGEELDRWQFLRMALESLFFDFK